LDKAIEREALSNSERRIITMDEQKTNEGTEQGTTNENPKERNINQSTPVIDNANSAAERLEKAAEILKTENDRMEAIHAKKMLGGGSEAGSEAEPTEETPQQYAKDVIAGKYNG
jgi:hypothetical protein